MKPPFILCDNGDVTLFETIGDLERNVESPDVVDVRAFDSTGQVLRLATSHPTYIPKKSIKIVSVDRVTASASGANEIAELEALLRDFLLRVSGKSYDQGDLSTLIAALRSMIGFTR